jgi:hypothetical protein
MANSSNPLPSIPTNPNKLHRIYSDSEERNIEKTILYVIFDAENKPRPYLYIDPDGGDVPENRVDCITLAELFKNGLLISIKNSFVLPYDMTIVNLGNDKFYTSVFTAMSQDISYNSTMLSVLTPVSFNSMEFNPRLSRGK